MPIIESCKFVNASAVVSYDIRDALRGVEGLSWGEANKTLVTVQRLVNAVEMCRLRHTPNAVQTILTLEALPEGVYIDLEN